MLPSPSVSACLKKVLTLRLCWVELATPIQEEREERVSVSSLLAAFSSSGSFGNSYLSDIWKAVAELTELPPKKSKVKNCPIKIQVMCTVFARLLPSPILFIGPLQLTLLILFVTPCTTFRFLTGLSCGIYSWLQISQHIACTHVCIENSASYLLSKQITQSDKIELICSWLVGAVCDTSHRFFFVYLIIISIGISACWFRNSVQIRELTPEHILFINMSLSKDKYIIKCRCLCRGFILFVNHITQQRDINKNQERSSIFIYIWRCKDTIFFFLRFKNWNITKQTYIWSSNMPEVERFF